MTQPAQPAPPSSAPPAPTTAPPASAPPAGQQPQTQPTGTPVPPTPQQGGGWPQQPATGYQQPGYPPGYPQQAMQYVPVMPIPPTLAAPPAGDASGDGDGQDVTKLPQWAQQRMAKLSDENAKRRVSERTAVVNQHAWMAAQQLGANAQAVLGSLAWQQASEKLDPTSADFGRHLAEAIHRTVTQNPWMAAQAPGYPPAPPAAPGAPGAPEGQPPAPSTPPGQHGQLPQAGHPGQPGYQPQPYPASGYPPPAYPPAPGYPAPQPPPGWLRPPTSGAEFATGNGGNAPITEEQLAQMSPQQVAEAFEKGQLKHLL